MGNLKFIIVILACLFVSNDGKMLESNGSARVRLQNDIFDQDILQYLPRLSGGLNVTVGLTLQNLLSIERNDVSLLGWLAVSWNHPKLVWEPEKYGGIDMVRIDMANLWAPDISIYNSLLVEDTFPLRAARAKALVGAGTGKVNLVEPIHVKLRGNSTTENGRKKLEVLMKLGSWTYDGDLVNVRIESGFVDVSTFVGLPGWRLTNATMSRTVTKYDCCVEKYIAIDVKMDLIRSRH